MHHTNQQGNTLGQILLCSSYYDTTDSGTQVEQFKIVESLNQMVVRYHIHVKTVAKRRKRTTVEDSQMGTRQPQHSTSAANTESSIG